MSEYDYEDEYDGPSKSEVKREMERWQQLGEHLTTLSAAQWNELTISDTLRAALEESKRIKQHGARRRHFQYIGRLMRDEQVETIQYEVDLLDPSSEVYGRRQKQFEQWRTRLVDNDKAVSDFMEQYPQIDRQQLRNLVRNARKEMSGETPKPGAAYKKLFQFIKSEAE